MSNAVAEAASPSAEHVMQCMEIWGGNQVTDRAVTMAGLEAWVYSRPHADASAGGDVHYVSSCATGRITRLMVADVTGHGLAVQETAIGLRTLMRKYVNFIDQTRFVQSMNSQFSALSQNGTFATAVVTTFFAPTNRLSLCNAGHPPPLLYWGAKKKWSYLEQVESADPESASNLPLGVIDIADYEQFEVDLKVGDLVLCYTDSLCESYAADGTMLGQAGLLAAIAEVPVNDPGTYVPRLLAHIGSLRDGNLQNDDVTTLLFRPTGSNTRTPLKTKLLAPFRVARAIIGSFGRRGEPAPWPEVSVANLGGAMLDPLGKVGAGRGKAPL